MIELKESETLKNVIDILKNDPENIWEKWKDDNVINCKTDNPSKGAGNGKPAGISKSCSKKYR